MAILSKACKPDNFEWHNSLKLSFTTTWGFPSNFVDCESFLESNSPNILALRETNLDDSIDSGNFSVRGYLPLIWKDSSTHMHGLALYVKEGLPFTQDLSLENSADSYLCFWLALLPSVSYLFFLHRSPSLLLCTVFYSISANKDEVLSINPSANVFIFRDFNVDHKDWLTYSGGTDRSGELCYNFPFSNDLTQMANFPTRIPDCDSHSPALLDFFLSSDASICFTMAFSPLGNSDHVDVSVSINFPSNSQWMSCFIAQLMTILVLIEMVFTIIWEMFHERTSLNSVLLLLLVNLARGLRLEFMYISLIENIRTTFTHLYRFQLLVLLP